MSGFLRHVVAPAVRLLAGALLQLSIWIDRPVSGLLRFSSRCFWGWDARLCSRCTWPTLPDGTCYQCQRSASGARSEETKR